MEAALELQGVSKRYRYFSLEPLSLSLQPGQILGLVGPAGAGKSTLLRLILGLVHADAGQIRVLGQPMPTAQALAKADVGYVSRDMGLFGSATLDWHMRWVASIYPGWDEALAQRLLKHFALHPGQRARQLSSGERMKALLLLTLARRPRLLLLDEPTSGLDPVARQEILGELLAVVEDPARTVLLSSHHTQDIERICDRIAFLDRGRLVADDDTDSYLQRWRRLSLDLPVDGVLPDVAGTVELRRDGRSAVLLTADYQPTLEAALSAAGITVHQSQRLTLEEIFVASVMQHRQERGE
ncbi:MAG: ABC transporter ATP-binding protein [Lysobacterales bacterium]